MSRKTRNKSSELALPILRILSLGWGVQSWTMAAMIAKGLLPPVDFAIHADTGHEREATYRFAEKWTPWLEEHGVRVVTVSNGANKVPSGNGIFIPAYTIKDIAKENNPVIIRRQNGGGEIYVPAFTATEQGGTLRRQCTGRWKTDPVRREIRHILAERGIKRPPAGAVEQWLGISLDEFQRMKMSQIRYITNHYPLIEARKTRNDCIQWLKENDLEVPPKSSCTFCPFHNRRAWAEMKAEGGADWQEALEVDRAIRKVRPPYDLYLSSVRKPLDEIDFRSEYEKMRDAGQMEVWADWDAECSGVCGV